MEKQEVTLHSGLYVISFHYFSNELIKILIWNTTENCKLLCVSNYEKNINYST
jgi:hypothetical protein